MHNTSPMTGASLTHRYLTENYALRRLIWATEHNASSTSGASSREDDRHASDCGDLGLPVAVPFEEVEHHFRSLASESGQEDED